MKKILFVTEKQAKKAISNINKNNYDSAALNKLYKAERNNKVYKKFDSLFLNSHNNFIKKYLEDIKHVVANSCLLIYCSYTYQNEDSYEFWINEIETLIDKLTKEIKSYSISLTYIFYEDLNYNEYDYVYKFIISYFNDEIRKNDSFYFDSKILLEVVLPFFGKIMFKELMNIIENYQTDKRKLSTYLHDLINRSKQLK